MKEKSSIIIILLFSFLLFTLNGRAQNYYWVFLKDKHNTKFNPIEYFDNKAIERRVNAGLALCDSTDFPVNSLYTKQIAQIADSVFYNSRWMNAISVYAYRNNIDSIKNLSFVKNVQRIYEQAAICSNVYDTTLALNEKYFLNKQTSILEAQFFKRNKINGQGVRIAVFDAGFPDVDQIPIFEHLIAGNKIIATYDFARNRENVYQNNAHGTEVLSCIAGKKNNTNLGLATEAEFLLARTEVSSEPKLEETNWVAALEWADKNGAQIINNSLGYTYHRYFPEEMNGETSIVAKAAKMAAAKGILVVSAMGNDGDNDWKVLATPADADSILSVGAIDPITMFHAPYSSFGPTADFRLKPNVVAPGKVIAAGQKALKLFSGTSFSAPLIAGFAACVWQMHPEYTNMQVLEEIQKSASLYPYYDYAHGYGIPKASYFFSNTHQATTESFTVKTSRNKVIIQFNKNLPQSTNATDYLYYHIADEAGKIEEYNVIEMDKLDDYTIPIKESFKNNKIRVFYRGTFKDINFSDL